MDESTPSKPLQEGYVSLKGSERHPTKSAKLIGPADAGETFKVTVVLRRRADGPALPGADYYAPAAPGKRKRMTEDEFVAKYGAHPGDADKVTTYAKGHGLAVDETHLGRRTVVLSGTVAQYTKAFGTELHTYEHTVDAGRGKEAITEKYRGRDGMISVPADLADMIVGVFGLDNRRVTKRNAGDPPNTKPITTVQEMCKLYGFPTNSAKGQTIAIFSEGGYLATDISKNFGGHPPTVTSITVDASNNGTADGETTQDIYIAGSAAPGANIAVYFTTYSQQGWVDLISRVIHPKAGDPKCSVISSSFYVSNGDDAATLAAEGVSTSWLTATSQAFEDAAMLGVTVCIASGDTGAQSKVGDGKAHVQYPGSDPWVLCVGGTTVGNISGSTFSEYVWNDSFTFGGGSGSGATGGGISDFFSVPWWQYGVGVPPSLNKPRVGRGVPDVAANASPNSGYPIILNGAQSSFPANGTSASAPLWAGFIAVLNAALGENVGFINPALYAIKGTGFRDIVPQTGATNNSFAGVTGYPATKGWDACTGWGSPNGTAMLNALKGLPYVMCELAVARNSDGRLEVFGVGTDQAVWHNDQTVPHAGPWSGWSSLGGVVTSAISAVVNSDGRMEIFARGTDDALWHNWQTAPHAGPWSGWSSLGGVITSDPTAIVNSDGRIEVFARGTDNALWHIWQTVPHAAPWSAWASLGGVITSDISAVVNTDGRIEVFVKGSDNALWHMWQTVPHATPWSAWSSLGGIITSDPCAVVNSDGRIEVFARGSNNALWHIWQTVPHAAPWSAWASLGGVLSSDISAVVNTDGRIEVFVRGTDMALWHIWQTVPHATPWSAWGSLGGILTSNPTASVNSDGRLEVFVRGTDWALWHLDQTVPHAAPWTAWSSLGGVLIDD